jgi:hypothetical protein
VVSWPAGCAGFELERASDLREWTPVEQTPDEVEGRLRIIWDATGGAQFFRMRQQ